MPSTQAAALPSRAAQVGAGHSIPWVTVTFAAVWCVVGIATLATDPLWDPDAFAYARDQGLHITLVTFAITHGSLEHLAANLLVWGFLAPEVERFSGGPRLALVWLAGSAMAAVAHGLVHAPDVSLYGASGGVAAMVAFALVVGWQCPFTGPANRRVTVWPGQVLYVWLAAEAWLWGAAALTATGSAGPAHLAGAAVGMLAAGLLHRRWPSTPNSRTGSGPGFAPVEQPVVSEPADLTSLR